MEKGFIYEVVVSSRFVIRNNHWPKIGPCFLREIELPESPLPCPGSTKIDLHASIGWKMSHDQAALFVNGEQPRRLIGSRKRVF